MSPHRRSSEEFLSQEPALERVARKPAGRRKGPFAGLPIVLQRRLQQAIDDYREETDAEERRKAEIEQEFFGRAFSREERLELRYAAMMKEARARDRLLESAWNTRKVQEFLGGVSHQTPHDRRHSGTLLAILDRGEWRYPDWQFDASGPDRVVDGLPDIIRALSVGTLAKIRWLSEANDLFGGRSPIEELRASNKERVLYEAQRLEVE